MQILFLFTHLFITQLTPLTLLFIIKGSPIKRGIAKAETLPPGGI